ncbi:MAG: SxtJ family membrane protein [Thermodesulfobacteriota bacterium]
MQIDETAQKEREKDTGLALLLICLLLLFFTEKSYYILPAIVILILTMTWPRFFAPFSLIWFGFSKVLGEIVSRVLLSLVFFLVAVPIGYIRKMLGYDSMKLNSWKKGNGSDSYFTDKDHSLTGKDLDRPY